MADIDSIFNEIMNRYLENTIFTSASKNKENVFLRFKNTGISGDINNLEEAIRQIIEEMVSEIREKETQTPGKTDEEKLQMTPASTGLTPEGIASKIAGETPRVLAETPDVLMEVFRKLLPVQIAFLAASLAPHVFKFMTRPGSELDLRYIRETKTEFNAFLERQQQHDTASGFRGAIATSTVDGFLAMNGANNQNTMRQYREGVGFYGHVFDITNEDNSKGLYFG